MPGSLHIVVVLLPGMDGSGDLFAPFVRVLPKWVDVRVAHYPDDTYLTYEQLANRARDLVPLGAPYLIIAESYSGPVAALLAAQPVGDLQAVVLVSSFVSPPFGRVARWIAKVVPAAAFRWRAPARILRWLLMDSATAPNVIAATQAAIARVKPAVLVQRLRDALSADFATALAAASVRVVYLSPTADRLLRARGLKSCLAARADIRVVDVAGPHFLLQCAPEGSLKALRQLGLLGGREESASAVS